MLRSPRSVVVKEAPVIKWALRHVGAWDSFPTLRVPPDST